MTFIVWLIYGIIACAVFGIVASFEKGQGLFEAMSEVLNKYPSAAYAITFAWAIMAIACVVFWPLLIAWLIFAKGRIFIKVFKEEYAKAKKAEREKKE